MPPLSNAPVQIIGAWTALEVLNPQTFDKPQDLEARARDIPKNVALIADFARGLPWETDDRGLPKKQLFYHVVLGTIDAARAFNALLDRYVDSRAERPRVKAEAVLASVVVDKNGIPVPDDAVVVSSFGWGLPVALEQDLAALAQWPTVAEQLQRELAAQLRRRDSKGNELPLDAATIERAFRWLLAELHLPEAYVCPPRFAVRAFQFFKLPDPPDPLLLNSFYLGDLARAQVRFANNSAPKALRLYVGLDKPATRRNLLQDTAALEGAIAPSAMPMGRWPAPGRHPLVLLQQAAVNLALKGAAEPGILAVNGPPGTGKTTLLRDVVAALVTQRAEAMCRFDDPARAFADSGQRIRLGQESATLYTLDKTLRGFEMLVASSNNGAVENVSAELPADSAVAADAGLSYFKPLSDVLLGRSTWGLVAGVLGNAGNRTRFMKTFWWDNEVGLASYLAEAAGTPQWVDEPPGPDNVKKKHRPRLVVEAAAPSSHSEALARWHAARAAFRERLETTRRLLADLEEVRLAVKNLPALTSAASASRASADAAVAKATGLKQKFHKALEDEQRAIESHQSAAARLAAQDSLRPSFLSRLFRTAAAKQWSTARAPLETAYRQAAGARSSCTSLAAKLEAGWKAEETTARKLTADAETAAQALAAAQRTLKEGKSRLGDRLVDDAYFGRSHEVRHLSVPWCDDRAHRARDEVFASAMALHKAFVDAAAHPIRGNLAGLMKAMGTAGRSTFVDGKAPLLTEVWATLFLVVPVVSTTFASVERMLGPLGPETLGWLLIDEAGQALPQAAVGALLRCRRAVVVGDPIQIEPVVPLPERLTQTICRRFGIDPDHFNAPEASAQTLADAATPFMAEFHGRQGSRHVGVPLLVHRRCAEPMFGIANAVAYQHLMVHAKAPKTSAIQDCLGASRWIDVQGSGHHHWCEQEGEVVLAMMRRLKEAGVPPNLYIVSPFRIVAQNIRRLLFDNPVVLSLSPNPQDWIRDHVGTVHTVQGREAEAVFFVLGAPNPDQRGARGWAGGRPNLLNVALTRAQEAVYVVGNRQLWRESGVFSELHTGMPA